MAKIKPNKKKAQTRDKSVLNRVVRSPSKAFTPPPPASPEFLLLQASAAIQQGDAAGAVPLAKRALSLLGSQSVDALPAVNLLGEIHVALGEIELARRYFQQAAAIDEDGLLDVELGGGAEKFLWLAQLSEEGGKDSVGWFEKGVTALKIQIQALQNRRKIDTETEAFLEEKKRKLAVALCGVVEVYMTDLSWEEDAEQTCETLVTEATMVAPGYAEPWQTLANVRISQSRIEDAKSALTRSLDLWKDLPPENLLVPDFPTRVSLARLLMEADMDVEAIQVLERLVGEDDSSVEVWYLGGWGLYLMGEKQKKVDVESDSGDGESWRVSWISSRQWLHQSIRLFEQQQYDDERLGAHANELLSVINKELGDEVLNPDEDNEEGEWEDESSDDEKEMTEA